MTTELEYLLVAANLAAYAMVALALMRKEEKIPTNVTLEQAFGMLEETLANSYPSLKDGYTWEEALEKLKSAKPPIGQIDWLDLEKILKRYEAFRYGGVEYGDVNANSVLQLSRKLKRREKVVS